MKERKQNNYGQKDEKRRKKPPQETGRPKKREDRKESKRAVKKEAKKKKAINKEFARVTYIFVGLFLVMMGYIVYFNAVKSKEIVNSPYNTRQDTFADRVIRGKILDKDGKVLAETKVDAGGKETRDYPYGRLFAHVIGYSVKGKSGLESEYNFELLTSNAFFGEKIMKEFRDEKNVGDNVVTTLDTDLQQAAYDALGDKKGAVVAIEPSTGKVLAMVSKPSFNANTVNSKWDTLNSDEDSILLNRATQGAYAPGSTFKLVTTLAYMRQNPSAYQNYSYDCDSSITVDGTTIHCSGRKAHGEQDLGMSLAHSCNSSYVNIGLDLNIGKYRDTAKDLLFNSKLPCELPYRKSNFSLNKKAPTSEVMMTAIGQGQTQVSPYHMALITSAIANGGTLMKPYLVNEVTNYTGSIVTKNKPDAYGELMTTQEAEQLSQYMRQVVKQGTARALNGRSYSVAGKTGTAEYSSDKEKAHSWFVGFSNVDNPDVAISVVIEGADNSGAKAVNIAKKVFDAYY